MDESATSELAIVEARPFDGHREGIATRRNETGDILSNIADAARRELDLALGVANLPPDRMLIVDMRRVQAFEARDLGLKPRLLHEAWIAGCDRLGHGELVGLASTQVLEAPHARIARQRGGDETGLALIVLPHGGIEAAERGIGEDFDLVMLVALAHNTALALLNLRGEPRHVEMVERLEAKLNVNAGAHRIARSKKNADLAGIEMVEQPLLGLGLPMVLHVRDL